MVPLKSTETERAVVTGPGRSGGWSGSVSRVAIWDDEQLRGWKQRQWLHNTVNAFNATQLNCKFKND